MKITLVTGNWAKIEQAKKVLKFLSLSDILINNETIDIFGEIE